MQTPSQRLLDRLLPGGLDAYVISRRTAGASWPSIAQDIREQLPREDAVSSETLRRWYPGLDRAEGDVA